MLGAPLAVCASAPDTTAKGSSLEAPASASNAASGRDRDATAERLEDILGRYGSELGHVTSVG